LSRASVVYAGELEFDLENDETLIGCTPEANIDLRGILKQEFVSRRHASISYRNSCYYLTDLQSLNGTKLNGTRLKPKEQEYELKNQDVILLCGSKQNGIQLIFRIRQPSAKEID
jgi:pSer/pThr/pTyr-binding forkhead associated (FHA) protein